MRGDNPFRRTNKYLFDPFPVSRRRFHQGTGGQSDELSSPELPRGVPGPPGHLVRMNRSPVQDPSAILTSSRDNMSWRLQAVKDSNPLTHQRRIKCFHVHELSSSVYSHLISGYTYVDNYLVRKKVLAQFLHSIAG